MKLKPKSYYELRVILFYWVMWIALILFLHWLVGCRCVYTGSGDSVACGCSLMSDMVIEDVLLEPPRIRIGEYTGSTDNLKILTPYGTLETE